MADLGTIRLDTTNSAIPSSTVPDWDSTTGDLGDNSTASFSYVNTNATDYYAHRWDIDDTPADFGSMDTLTVHVYAAWTPAPTNTTWDHIYVLIVGSDGSTILAQGSGTPDPTTPATGWMRVGGPGTSTTITEYSVSFTAVTAGDKTAWDGARAYVALYRNRSKGGGTQEMRVHEVWFTGTYTAASGDVTANVGVLDVNVNVLSATGAGGSLYTASALDINASVLAIESAGQTSETVNVGVLDVSVAVSSVTVTGDASYTASVQDISLAVNSATGAGGCTVTVPTLGGAGGTVGSDTFTEASTGKVNLDTHTAETGGTWVKRWQEPGFTRDLWLDRTNDNVTPYPPSSTGDADIRDCAYSLGSVTVGDGYVQAQLVHGTGIGSSWLVIRQPTDNLDTFYFVKWDSAGQLYLFRNTDYSYNVISSGTNIGTSTKWVRLEASGVSPTTLKVYYATTEGGLDVASPTYDTTDSTAANQVASGYVGLAGEYDDDFGQSSGVIDNFTAYDSSTGGSFGPVLAINAATQRTDDTASVGLLDVNLSVGSVTVAADAQVSTNLLDVTLAVLSATAGGSASVDVGLLDANLAVNAATATGDAILTAGLHDVTLSAFAVTVDTGASPGVTVDVGVVDVSLSQVAATATGDALYDANTQDVSAAINAVTVTGSALYTAAQLDIALAINAATATGDALASQATQDINASILSVAFAGQGSETANVGVVDVSLAQYAASATGDSTYTASVLDLDLVSYSATAGGGTIVDAGLLSIALSPFGVTVTESVTADVAVVDIPIALHSASAVFDASVAVGSQDISLATNVVEVLISSGFVELAGGAAGESGAYGGIPRLRINARRTDIYGNSTIEYLRLGEAD